MACKIEDYGLIGDCETAALVGRDGSIDWLCWPAFDSDACFTALLGTSREGRWLIAPADEITETSRRYWDDTLILETRFATAGGTVDEHPNWRRRLPVAIGDIAAAIDAAALKTATRERIGAAA